MRKLFYLIIIFSLSILLTMAQEFLEVSLVKSIYIGPYSLNFFYIIENFVIFSNKDTLIIYDIKDNKEINRFKVRSSLIKDSDNIYITNIIPIDSKKIAIVNNEPYLTIYDFIKGSDLPLKYNKENTFKKSDKFPLTRIEKIEDLIISPFANLLIEKIHYMDYFIGGFIPLNEWYEFNVIDISNKILLYKISTKDYLEFDPYFSNKGQFLFLFNVILKNKKEYALIIKEAKSGRDLAYFYEKDRVTGWNVSRDDKFLILSLGEKEETKIIDLLSLKEIKSIPYIGNPFISPSGKFFAIEGNKIITVFSLTTGLALFSIFGSHPIFSWDDYLLAYSLGEHFLSPTKEFVIYDWNREIRKKITLDDEYFLEKIEFTKDRKYIILLLLGGDGYKILIYQIKGGG